MFVNDFSGKEPILNPIGLDYTNGPNLHDGRIDILYESTTNFFDINFQTMVVQNVYMGVDPPSNIPNSYIHFQITLDCNHLYNCSLYLRFA